jgi:CheY-like chemotaxis protein
MDTPLTILVAEDELGDELLLQRAFQLAGVEAPVHFARDGREVLNYLQGKGPFENPVENPLPNLLLLDLYLPYVNGFEVLEWVRGQPGLKRMLVIVFTGSETTEDMERAYALGANAYVVKPSAPRDLVRFVERLQKYWLSINSYPAESLVPALTFA